PMLKEDMFINNIHSRNQDRIHVKRVFDDISNKANRGCGLYYEIYQARLMRGLIEHTVKLKSSDANKLISYAASQGYEITEDRYNAAIKAEDECLTEITRAQV
ncbi:hypothetical protein, partial [Klebsiella pneumoniae]